MDKHNLIHWACALLGGVHALTVEQLTGVVVMVIMFLNFCVNWSDKRKTRALLQQQLKQQTRQPKYPRQRSTKKP